jgi:phosphate-selective porin OprO and OprP
MVALAAALLGVGGGDLSAQVAIPIEAPQEGAAPRVLSLTLAGWVQPRYEYFHSDAEEDASSFLLRRARLDVQGSVFDRRLTFRIMPELARTANLRDAWVDYAFSPALRLRAGQFSVPFQWHRFVAPRTQHFAERGVPSETFGFPNGRDVGVMLHGRNAGQTAQWGAGLFDGAGRNVARSNSTGHMASVRLGRALTGSLPREEVDLAHSPAPQLSLGLGVQGATRSEVAAWSLGRSATGNERADWLTGTADLHLRWRGLSLAGDAYLRRVRPDDGAVEPYTGSGGMISAGYTLVPRRLDVVGRWSSLRLDSGARDTAHRQWGGGVNLYLVGHDAKLRVQYLSDEARRPGSPTVRSGTFVVEQHVQF